MDNEINVNAGLKPLAEDVKKLNTLMYVVIFVLFIGFASMFVGVSALILDQLHFNNQVYRDGYLEKTVETRNVIKPVFVKPPLKD